MVRRRPEQNEKVESESESCSVVSISLRPHGLYSPWNSPGQNTRVGNLSLLQEVFPTQESNQGLLHSRQILYQLSYEGSPEAPYSRSKSSPHLMVSLGRDIEA